MHLHAIEIAGFKSFAGEVRLVFAPGITALVGPNGGGKSNVVDALRWALGEQRPRELRLERWEQVLFAAEGGKRVAGLAEVTLTFDNHDGAMPNWPATLTIGRRFFRSGESEYRINGETVRLRDVSDLFLDSGLGRAAYACIGQGQVERALWLKPEERREQLDEAAGVSRYRARREETLLHLERVRAALDRLGDLQRTLGEQLAAVAPQAERERQYLELQRQVEEWRRAVRAYQHARAVRRMEALRQQLAQSQAAGLAWQAQRQAAEAEVARVQAELAQLEFARGQAQARADSWLEEMRRLSQTSAELQARREALGLRLAGQRAGLQPLERRLAELAEELASVPDPPAGDGTAVDPAPGQWTTAWQQVQEVVAATQREAAARQAEYEALRQRLRRWTDRLLWEAEGDAGEAPDAVPALQHALAERLQALEAAARQAEAEAERQRERWRQLHAFVEEKRQALEQRRRHLEAQRARLAAARELEASGADLSPGVRAVLEAQRRGQAEGVRGTLGSLVQPDATARVAIWAALGGRQHDIVVETEAQARRLVAYLQANGLGRATFLPLDIVRPARVPHEDVGLGAAPGMLGWAMELVRFPDGLEHAVAHVLGRVLVAATLADAVRLGRSHRFRYRTVTIDGQILHAGGAVTGGSPVERGSRWGRREEIAELESRVRTGEAQLREQEGLWESATQEAREAREAYEAAREAAAEAVRRWRQVQEGFRRFQAEEPDWPERLEAARSAFEAARAQWQAAEAAQARLAGEREAEWERQKQWAAQQQAAALRAQAAAERQRLAHQVELARQAIAAMEEELRDIERRQAHTARQLSEATTAAGRLEEERQAGETRRRMLEEKLAEATDTLRRLEEAGRQRESRQAQWEGEVRRLREQWGEGPPPAAPDWSDAQASAHQARLTELERQWRTASPEAQGFQPGSLGWFEQLQARVQQLRGEAEDLTAACGRLEAVLAELDQETDRRRAATVAAVEQAFADSCRSLFGGGQAGLKWEGGAGGIDLWVQPPGKRQHPVGLLSGGERALGALAWIFALLAVRPAPVVVLDEVEASLDEANAERFARFLAAKRDNGAQFIAVTHHRSTMMVADVLWGVTSDGHGASRVVSVQLGAAEREPVVSEAGTARRSDQTEG